ncbi:hypothetical protein NUW58_g1213 [Xylaria curta]|uniref:Uncharacterized protein n=1 Tax=Xylaria curta TaxID=42375 RepID=A0ACC1PP70_9PEZI|nr:hypothetical protein NUW58_g1213 [Xylaria curta]
MEEERATTPIPATLEAVSQPDPASPTTSAAIAQLPGITAMDASATSPQLNHDFHWKLTQSYEQNCEPSRTCTYERAHAAFTLHAGQGPSAPEMHTIWLPAQG